MKRLPSLPLIVFMVAGIVFNSCKKDNSSGPSTTTPVLTSTTATIITNASAQSGGTISSDGGASVTARGVCWGTAANPTIANSKTTDGSGTGNFTSWLTGLTANTTYHVRAYAINNVGTGYGHDISFTTLPASSTTVMDIDGNIYNTVTIGSQVWMKENLKTTHYRNGEAIPTDLSDAAWGAAITGAYSIYSNDANNNTVYGKLYNWYAAVDTRNIAPQGWHVPTKVEWDILVNTLGGYMSAGGAMKETGTTHWNAPNTGATNSSGFTGLPGGFRNSNGSYTYIGNGGYGWSTTPDGSLDAEAIGLFNNTSEAAQISGSKLYGIAIRCVKD